MMCSLLPSVPVDVVARMRALSAILDGYRFSFVNESILQGSIGRVLAAEGERFTREFQLTPADRIDFMFADGIGLEVKVDGSLADVTRQVHRYAKVPEIVGLLLVTSRRRHDRLPDALNGKPVRVHVLAGGLA